MAGIPSSAFNPVCYSGLTPPSSVSEKERAAGFAVWYLLKLVNGEVDTFEMLTGRRFECTLRECQVSVVSLDVDKIRITVTLALGTERKFGGSR